MIHVGGSVSTSDMGYVMIAGGGRRSVSMLRVSVGYFIDAETETTS